LTETDYAPVAAALSGNNVDCVVNIADPEVTPALVTAIAQGGTKMVLGGVDAQFTPQIVQQLGSAANGDIYASQYYPPNGNHAGVVTFRAAMARYEPTASVTSVAEEAWAGVQYFTAAVKKISGSITSASFAKSIATLGEVNLGVTAPFNNETRNPIAAYNRVSDPHEFIAKIENGNAKELETVNVQPAVKLQSTGKGNIGS
jgi:ABC-type branched-subunit amino acid transport system substrate-binding protein